STIALELGAVAVSVETALSGASTLSFYDFLLATLPVHLAIGICEGVVMGMVLIFVQRTSPDILQESHSPWGVSNTAVERVRTHNRRLTLLTLGIITICMGVAFAWISAFNPDGFNWLAANVGELPNLAPVSRSFTIVIPDYSLRISGIIGIGIVLTTIFVIGMVTFRSKRRKAQAQATVFHRYY
ncbi:MAG: energy-coupling factor ABC transporter permease, partial [Muribaculaceae bacterium]|nr:energy-coupling factor ABC transporter permease [Muribaculaceae bacterium]